MKQFMQLQPRKWKDIYTTYIQSIDQTPEERSQKVIDYLTSVGFSDEQASSIAASLIKTFTDDLSNTFIDSDQEEACLSIQDIKLLKEKLLHEPSKDIRRLLVTLLVYARANPHPSFWIHYDKKVINFLASIHKLKVSDQNLLTIQLHNLYNLDMQVVGSVQPIPCYRISWQAEQPPIEDASNPLVLIGPLNPATIASFTDSIPYEEQPKGGGAQNGRY